MSLPFSARAGQSVLRLAVLVVTSALVLGGCGTEAKKRTAPSPSVALPTQSVTLPSGVTLTKPGTQLPFGEAATVGFAPTADRSTALELNVRRVLQGKIEDLAAYNLDARAKASRPYYVTVTVKNVGEGQIGRSAIPLWGLGADNTLIGASGFTNSFGRCPSRPLPADFSGGRSASTCLMFLVPQGGSIVGVSYRPVMADEPIVWKGKISTPVQHKTQKKKAKP
ncbi:MAG: hypothetical protein M3Y66_05010 [Actinomycetota bacterium]|nr:hypothetical protein [Actinomycetota bacterium]